MDATLRNRMDESMANACLTIIRSQNKRVKRMVLYAISEELKEEQDTHTVKDNGWAMFGLRGIVKDQMSDDDARCEYLNDKYGL